MKCRRMEMFLLCEWNDSKNDNINQRRCKISWYLKNTKENSYGEIRRLWKAKQMSLLYCIAVLILERQESRDSRADADEQQMSNHSALTTCEILDKLLSFWASSFLICHMWIRKEPPLLRWA